MVSVSMVLGGILGNVLTLPLDFKKTQLQVFGQATKSRLRQKMIGWKVLTLKSFISTYTKNLSLNWIKESPAQLIILSSLISSILNPLDLIIVNLQSFKPTDYIKTQKDLYKRIINYEKIYGLYRGFVPNLFKHLSFLTGAVLAEKQINVPDSYSLVFIKIFLSHTVSSFFSYPFDVLKTQMQRYQDEGLNSNLKECVIEVYNSRGIKGFYNGIGLYYLRNSISALVFYFFTYHGIDYSNRLVYNDLNNNKD